MATEQAVVFVVAVDLCLQMVYSLLSHCWSGDNGICPWMSSDIYSSGKQPLA